MLRTALRRALVEAAPAASAARAPASSLLAERVVGAASASASSSASAPAATAAAAALWPRLAPFSSAAAAAAAAPRPSEQQQQQGQDAESRLRLANKLVYRAKQRGFLELDLLVGAWAERAIPAMTTRAALLDASVLLDAENPDLYKWLTGQEEPPEAMARNSAFADVRAHVKGMLGEHVHPGARAARGAEWRRGWDDGDGKVKGGAAAAAAGIGGDAAGGGEKAEP